MTKYIVTVDEYGNRCWKNESNQFHRENGPAIEWSDGTKEWYLDGKLHRTDGPAVEWFDGDKYWYLNGVKLTESEFLAKTKKAPCEDKVVEIDGVKYKLIKA